MPAVQHASSNAESGIVVMTFPHTLRATTQAVRFTVKVGNCDLYCFGWYIQKLLSSVSEQVSSLPCLIRVSRNRGERELESNRDGETEHQRERGNESDFRSRVWQERREWMV